MKFFQFICACCGGCFAVWLDVKNGPAIGLFALVAAYSGTLLLLAGARLLKIEQPLERNIAVGDARQTRPLDRRPGPDHGVEVL